MAGEQQTADATAIIEEDTDADFEAGFADAGTGTTETPADTSEEGAAAAPAPAAAAPAAAPAPAATPAPPAAPAAPKKVEIDEAELAALRSKAANSDEQIAGIQRNFDKVFGQVGNLKQVVDKLKAETPAGEKVEIDEADFKELAETYPELAKFTLQGLNKALAKMRGTAGADSEAVDRIVTEKLQAARTEISAQVTTQVTDSVLNGIVPRWREQVNKPAFTAWIAAQPEDVKALAQSEDIGDAAEMLRMFRDHQRKPPASPAPAAPAPPAAAPKPHPRQRQIAAAVAPRGDGAPAPAAAATEDDDFNAGFKAGKV